MTITTAKERYLIRQIEINDFSEYIKKTDKVRPKPYVQGKCRVPIKYSDPNKYEFREIKYWGKRLKVLVQKSDGQMLTANSKTAGKPRYVKVNGQDIYNQRDNAFVRAFMKETLTKYFKEYFDKVEPITDIEQFPLIVEVLFYIHDMGKFNIDNDNKWIWEKAIQDCLTKCKVLPEDSPDIISRNEKETIFIPENEEQKLIINIYGRR